MMTGSHWSGHDPETGCGLMLAAGLLVVAVVLAVLIAALATGLWRP